MLTIQATPEVLETLAKAGVMVNIANTDAAPDCAERDIESELALAEASASRVAIALETAESVRIDMDRASTVLEQYAQDLAEATHFLKNGDENGVGKKILEDLSPDICALIGKFHALDSTRITSEEHGDIVLAQSLAVLGRIGEVAVEQGLIEETDEIEDMLDEVKPSVETITDPEPEVREVDDCNCLACNVRRATGFSLYVARR